MKTQRANIKPFITKDLSEIRELMHPSLHGNQKQSLAEASVLPGQTTQRHRHLKSEEIYYILQGTGSMQLGDETFPVLAEETICIPPGTPHCISNTSSTETLRFLCACSPAYQNEDTEILND